MRILKIAAVMACIVALPNMASAAAKPAATTPDGAFKKFCAICHSIEAGKNKGGPSLHNIIGKKAGTVEGYKKYKGLKGADFTWTEENLDVFIANPKKFVKENTSNTRSGMTAKVKKAPDRALVMEYLKSH